MRGITVDLHIENMSATRQVVIGSLHLCLMTGRTLVIDRHVIGVRIVVAIRHTGDHTELLTVFLSEFSTQALCRCCEYGVVMVITVTELIDPVTHIGDNFQTQCLTFLTLTMMLTRQCHQTLCQSDETDTKCTLVDDTLHCVHRTQFVCTDP